MGFGGPHAGYIAVRDGLAAAAARPAGRRVRRRRRRTRPTGSRCRPASSTSAGRRRPATSAPRRCCWPSSPAMYAAYHGPDGLAAIARRVHRQAAALAATLRAAGIESCTARSSTPSPVARARRGPPTAVAAAAPGAGYNLHLAGAGRGRRSPATRRPPTRTCGRWPRAGRPPGRASWPAEGRDALPGRRCGGPRRSSPTRCSTRTAARPRCCATCAGWPTSTSRWTGR